MACASSSAVVALVVTCLLACFAGSVAQLAASPPACSRERSRHARAVLDEFFHPVVEKNQFELPPTCPFGKPKDMYLEHEKHKEVVRRTQYKSLYSDKMFKSEYYVDKHMDNRHGDKIPKNADVCLAEYCDVLRCDGFRKWRASDAKARLEHAMDALQDITHMRKYKNNFGCDDTQLRSVRRHCEAIVRRCFPSPEERGEVAEKENRHDAVALRLREYFSRHHCEFLTCHGVDQMFNVMAAHRPEETGTVRRVLVWFVCVVLVAHYAAAGFRKRGRETDDIRPFAGRRKKKRFGPLGLLLRLFDGFAGFFLTLTGKRRIRKKQM